MRWRGAAWILLCLALGACKKTPSPGQACDSEGEAVCRDPQAMVACRLGSWELTACKGPAGCATQGAIVKCDETLAAEGDPCGKPEGEHFSCSLDKRAELSCKDGTWKTVAKCRGPKGCEAKFPFVSCDNSVAAGGDPCDKESDAACSEDGKSILECKAGKFVATEQCDGKCKAEGLFVKCQ